MNRAKFNKNDPRHLGSMGLHILAINDMPVDKWLNYFTSEEMKQAALEDENGYIGRLPPHQQDKVRDLLSSGAEVAFNNMVDRTDALIAMSKSPTASASVALVGSVMKETITTDKGIFVSVEVLKEKISRVYIIQNFEEVWVEALTLSKLDADVEYISTTAKKLLLNSIKSAIVSVVEKTVVDL